jgi:hypothetical protein
LIIDLFKNARYISATAMLSRRPFDAPTRQTPRELNPRPHSGRQTRSAENARNAEKQKMLSIQRLGGKRRACQKIAENAEIHAG